MARSKIVQALSEERAPEEPEVPPVETPQEGSAPLEPPEGETPPSQEQPPAEPPAEEEPSVEVEGVQVPLSRLRALIQFGDYVETHPEQAQDIVDYLEGRRRIVPFEEEQAPQAPAAEISEDDLSDLPEPVRAKLRAVDELNERVSYLQERTFTDEAQRNLAGVEVGMRQFAQRYGLSPAEMEALSAATARAGVMPMTTRMAGDVVRGTEDALEFVYFRNPANRQRELDRIQRANKESTDRQRKASKLAGSGGNTPRTPEPVKLDAEAKHKAIVEELSKAMSGGTE